MPEKCSTYFFAGVTSSFSCANHLDLLSPGSTAVHQGLGEAVDEKGAGLVRAEPPEGAEARCWETRVAGSLLVVAEWVEKEAESH